jgi:hypothetical protein
MVRVIGRPVALAVAILSATSVLYAASPDPPRATDPSNGSYLVSTRRDRIGRITAPVTINGQGPFRFMIDTGSNHTVIASATLTKLGLTSDETHLVSVTGIINTELAPTAHIDSLDAGDMHFQRQDMPVLSGPVFAGIDGILGMDAFDGMRVTADFHRGRISIVRSPNHRPKSGHYVLNATFLSDRLLMVDAQVAHVKVKAIIDTGGQRTLGNPALLAALTRGRSHYHPIQTNVIGVTSVAAVGTVDRAPEIRVGTIDIADLYAVYGNFQIFRIWGLTDTPAILIGMDVLGTLSDLTIDYRRKEVDFLPRENTQPTIETHWSSLPEF